MKKSCEKARQAYEECCKLNLEQKEPKRAGELAKKLICHALKPKRNGEKILCPECYEYLLERMKRHNREMHQKHTIR